MAEHKFDPDVAEEVGIIPAILYKNINYWCEHNRVNGTHFYDGLYWTYNSIKAFKELFPYMSEKQIRGALKTLEDKGYIKTGNYNKASFDHTIWYADLMAERFSQKGKSNCPTGQIELTQGANRIAPEGNAIPNINTDNKPTYINTDSKKERKGAATQTYEEILDSVDYIRENQELRNVYLEFIKMRKLIKKPLTDYALKTIINKAHKLANGDIHLIKEIVEQSVANCYQGVFPLKTDNQFAVKCDNPFSDPNL